MGSREALHARLAEVLGSVHADTLMRYLPVVSITELATTGDIDRLAYRMDRFEERMDRFEERMDRFEERMDRLEQRLDRFESHLIDFGGQLHSWGRTFITVLAGSLTALALAVVASRLLGIG